MDARGAAALSQRIEFHQHWRQAAAVRDGLQCATDPDAKTLSEIGDGERHYLDGTIKLLIGGRWRSRRPD